MLRTDQVVTYPSKFPRKMNGAPSSREIGGRRYTRPTSQDLEHKATMLYGISYSIIAVDKKYMIYEQEN